MDNKLFRHQKNLKAFNNQRKLWLKLSAFVVGAIITITVDWNTIEPKVLWAVALVGTVLAAIWWYWTMQVISQLIEHRKEESEILNDVITCIREIKEDVKKLPK
jgi:uncharacterized membrane protein